MQPSTPPQHNSVTRTGCKFSVFVAKMKTCTLDCSHCVRTAVWTAVWTLFRTAVWTFQILVVKVLQLLMFDSGWTLATHTCFSFYMFVINPLSCTCVIRCMHCMMITITRPPLYRHVPLHYYWTDFKWSTTLNINHSNIKPSTNKQNNITTDDNIIPQGLCLHSRD